MQLFPAYATIKQLLRHLRLGYLRQIKSRYIRTMLASGFEDI